MRAGRFGWNSKSIPQFSGTLEAVYLSASCGFTKPELKSTAQLSLSFSDDRVGACSVFLAAPPVKLFMWTIQFCSLEQVNNQIDVDWILKQAL